MERSAFLEILKESYSAYYNIVPNDDLTELPLVFRGEFFASGEQYFLIKSARIWSNETNEYVYLFSAPAFTAELINTCIDYALEDGLPRVKPHKEHQYTNFLVIFVAETIGSEETKVIKKRRFSKSYNHSLWGYSLLKVAGVELNTEKLITNRAGHDLTGFYKKLFVSRKEDGKTGRNIKLFSFKE